MRRNRFGIGLLLGFVLFPMLLQAQLRQTLPIALQWHGVAENHNAHDTLLYIDLEDGDYFNFSSIPEYCCSVSIYDDAVKVDVVLKNVKAAPLSDAERMAIEGFSFDTDFVVNAMPLRSRDEALLSIRIMPFRQRGDQVEKLLSATVDITLTPDMSLIKQPPTFASRSAMASGDWYKVGLPETGIYKLTYDELKSLGVNVESVDPREIRIYHNGGGVLPELNAEARHDDLVEIPIYVAGEADGKLDKNDYVLFYGRGPVCWKYNVENAAFEHVQNMYDDYAYAFVVTGLGPGQRISEANAILADAQIQVTDFVDYQVHESDEVNLNHVGRTFYGDKMEGTISKSFDFDFPNVVTSKLYRIRTELASRNFSSASFNVLVDNVDKAYYSVGAVAASDQIVYAGDAGGWVSGYPTGNTLHVTIKHNATSTSTSNGYIDYISVNAWRNLKFVGPQMMFRNPEAALINKVYEFRLADVSQQVQVWNVTDPVAPAIVNGQMNGSTFIFKMNGDRNNEFIAFNGSSYCTAKAFGKVDNQNLHGIRDVGFVILTYPDFMAQAERLRDLHARLDPDMTTCVVTPEQVYNEFSCGAKDVTAIRDFCRMLYFDSNVGKRIKYLLLLGDCSYDHKNRTELVDFVPSYEAVSSLKMTKAFVTDDYYGFMDENEGNLAQSLADIGIGRFPVQTEEQAARMVDKVERYVVKDATTMQPWRNVVTFFADDDSGFVPNAETLVACLPNEGVVVDKIYLDAYPQINSPGGAIAPDVNAVINSRMEKGTLVLNYVGHGGEVQLAEERILQRKDVDSWRNAPMYPLMITGTCEFSRFDDHNRTSLGEYSFLNPYGGMIAMFTTSRVTYGPDNLAFMKGVYNNLFRINGGEYYHLGDVYRMAKTVGGEAEKRYVFFGDPALRLVYPKWKVETLSINGNSPSYALDSIQINDTTWQTYKIYNDTLSALQPVEIEGAVKDLNGNVASNFNGVVHVTMYDKEADLTTMGTSGAGGTVYHFKLRNSVIFNGKTEVKNGHFKIDFIVPRDIAYRYGQGLISYYATDYEMDANGSCNSFIIGGFYDEAFDDTDAPEIRLFIDDSLFVSGGVTGENPTLLAYVADESGINTTGAGIGHDIMATLSGSSKNSYCLNDYFSSEINDPGKGVITYKMLDLEDGDYTLTLKVWDIYNNSNTATIDFTVIHSDGMVIEHLANSPNPVTDETCFSFDHNQIGNNMKVDIHIFDIMGRWVTTLSNQVNGSSMRTAPIRWNGRGAHGEALRNGVYVYRVVATNDKGEKASVVSKLVLTK